MPTAIVRAVSPAINRCELSYLERREIDVPRAMEQHRDYVRCLEQLGATVLSLAAEPDLPDSVFVEDPAVVVDEVAVIAHMGAESRRAEAESLAHALAAFRRLEWLKSPATLEGGDVIRIGRTLYVGASQRTNTEGIAQLAAVLAPFGYDVRAVEVRGCLHLKSGACHLGRGTLLVNPEWIDAGAFDDYKLIDVAEAWAADVLEIGGVILMPEGFPETRRRLEHAGFAVRSVDVSELQKAEAGVTCMSIVFDERP